MAERPVCIPSVPVADDATLTAHVRHALSLGLPSVGYHFPHDSVAVLIASGPSLESQLDSIRRQRAKGRPLIAIKDAHDFLILHGIVPDYAIVIDPMETQWQCFRQKHHDVKYFVASQCHPSMFVHLTDCQVWLFHLTFNHNLAYKGYGKFPTIGGGTTTGLRAIFLFYTLGWRRFELYGYDSCLQAGRLRVESAWTREGEEKQSVVSVKVGGRTFVCNPGMAVQAQEFQNFWTHHQIPGAFIQSYGDGLLTAILRERQRARVFDPFEQEHRHLQQARQAEEEACRQSLYHL